MPPPPATWTRRTIGTVPAWRSLALGLISAIAVWFTAAGPLGEAITGLFRLLVGNAALLLPVLLVVAAVHLLRQQPHPERRGRCWSAASRCCCRSPACCTWRPTRRATRPAGRTPVG